MYPFTSFEIHSTFNCLIVLIVDFIRYKQTRAGNSREGKRSDQNTMSGIDRQSELITVSILTTTD